MRWEHEEIWWERNGLYVRWIGGVETDGGDGSETGSVTKKGKKINNQYRCKSHPDFRDKEESNNNNNNNTVNLVRTR